MPIHWRAASRCSSMAQLIPMSARTVRRWRTTNFFILVNTWWEPLAFQLPADVATRQWEIVCDSFDPARRDNAATNLEAGPRSIVVLRSPAAKTAG